MKNKFQYGRQISYFDFEIPKLKKRATRWQKHELKTFKAKHTTENRMNSRDLIFKMLEIVFHTLIRGGLNRSEQSEPLDLD